MRTYILLCLSILNNVSFFVFFKKYGIYLCYLRLSIFTIRLHIQNDIHKKINNSRILPLKAILYDITKFCTNSKFHKNRCIILQSWLISDNVTRHLYNIGFAKNISYIRGWIDLLLLTILSPIIYKNTHLALEISKKGRIATFKKYIANAKWQWVFNPSTNRLHL